MAYKRSEKAQRRVEKLIAEGKGKEYEYFVSTTHVTKNGVTYVEERYLKYDPLTGQCKRRPKEEGGGSRRIGKIDPVTGQIIPTNKGRKKAERVAAEKAREELFKAYADSQKPADIVATLETRTVEKTESVEETETVETVDTTIAQVDCVTAENTEVTTNLPADSADDYELVRVRSGAVNLLNIVTEKLGINNSLFLAFNSERGQKILSVVHYAVMNGWNITEIEDYQEARDLIYAEGLSSGMVYQLLQDVGKDGKAVHKVMRDLTLSGGKSQIYALDTTSVSTYNKQMAEVKFGHNKAKDGLPIYKLANLFNIEQNIPVSLSIFQGNTADSTIIDYILDELESYGVEDPELCMDRGFTVQKNLLHLCEKNVKFIGAVKMSERWVNNLCNSSFGDYKNAYIALEDPTNIVAHTPFTTGITKECEVLFSKTSQSIISKPAKDPKRASQYVKYSLHFSVFKNHARATDELQNYYKYVEELKEEIDIGLKVTLTNNEIAKLEKAHDVNIDDDGQIHIQINPERALKHKAQCGMYCIINNVKRDTKETFNVYKKRNCIETSFRVGKNDFKGDHPRVWSIDSVNGAEFIRMLAVGLQLTLTDIFKILKKKSIKKCKDSTISASERAMFNSLRKWLNERRSTQDAVKWFDGIIRTDLQNKFGKKSYQTPSTQLEKFIIEQIQITLSYSNFRDNLLKDDY